MEPGLIILSICTCTAVVFFTLGVQPVIVRFWRAVRRAYRSEELQAEREAPLLRTFYPLIHVIARYNHNTWWGKHKNRLRVLLRQAGAPIEIQAEEFMAVGELSAGACCLLALLVLKGVFGLPLVLCLLLGFGGYFIPTVWLRSYVEDRRAAIHRQLPYMIDLLVMAMEAGSSFLDALAIYIRDHRAEALAEEWTLFLNELNLGRTRREALMNLAERVGSDDIRSLAVTVTQGEEMGTPLGVLLRVYADGLRLKRSQRAEQVAGEAAVRILGPSMLVMVAVVLLVLGPILIKYIRGGLLV